MTSSQREELIRAYLEGRMSLEQEHDFFIDVALDKDLRLELKAQQTIDSAFRKDSVVDSSEINRLQREVSAMLVASRSDVGGNDGARISGRGSENGRGRRAATLIGEALLVAVLGLLPGHIDAPSDRPSTVVPTAIPSVESSRSASEQPSSPRTPGIPDDGRQPQRLEPALRSTATDDRPAPTVERPVRPDISRTSAPTEVPDHTPARRQTAASATATPSSSSDDDRNDSLNVGVKIRIEPQQE